MCMYEDVSRLVHTCTCMSHPVFFEYVEICGYVYLYTAMFWINNYCGMLNSNVHTVYWEILN